MSDILKRGPLAERNRMKRDKKGKDENRGKMGDVQKVVAVQEKKPI